ncbi:MAG TPA: hypothetical protein PKM56_19120, partial [Candidatus Rifleibacterium sp.]|nr:hypothetical protein [Candidatus Rifleibacterium sp.]
MPAKTLELELKPEMILAAGLEAMKACFASGKIFVFAATDIELFQFARPHEQSLHLAEGSAKMNVFAHNSEG